MRSFGIYLAGLFILVFTMDRLAASFLDCLYVKTMTGQSGGKINYYLSLPTPPDLLIMGNSRAYYQVVPDSFKMPTYNIAHSATDDCFQRGLLAVLEEKKQLPKTILLQIDPGQYLGQEGITRKNLNSVEFLRYYYGKNEEVTTLINNEGSTKKYLFYFHTYRYNGRVLTLLNNYFKTVLHPKQLQTGYDLIPAEATDSIYTLRSIQREVFPPAKFLSEYTTDLQSIISTCKRLHIRLILFTSPYFSRAMADYLKPSTDKIKLLCGENKIPYINYLELSLPGLSTSASYWKDPNHLNHLGAEIQSRDLSNRVKQLLDEIRP